MIIDEYESPSILAQYNDFIITYPEAVCCAIEVKTNLSIEDFHAGVKNIKEIKKIGFLNKKVIGGLIFAFKGNHLTKENLTKWYEVEEKTDFQEYPDLILCLREGLITKWHVKNPNKGHYFMLGDNEELKWRSLSIFIATVIKFCEVQAEIKDRNPYERFAFISGSLSKEYFLFGEGLCNSE